MALPQYQRLPISVTLTFRSIDRHVRREWELHLPWVQGLMRWCIVDCRDPCQRPLRQRFLQLHAQVSPSPHVNEFVTHASLAVVARQANASAEATVHLVVAV